MAETTNFSNNRKNVLLCNLLISSIHWRAWWKQENSKYIDCPSREELGDAAKVPVLWVLRTRGWSGTALCHYLLHFGSWADSGFGRTQGKPDLGESHDLCQRCVVYPYGSEREIYILGRPKLKVRRVKVRDEFRTVNSFLNLFSLRAGRGIWKWPRSGVQILREGPTPNN